MHRFDKLTIERLPARVEFEARVKGLSFDLPPWDEFKKDIDTGTSIKAMAKKWGDVHWVTMKGWISLYKESKEGNANVRTDIREERPQV
jgi:hypothetical protein